MNSDIRFKNLQESELTKKPFVKACNEGKHVQKQIDEAVIFVHC